MWISLPMDASHDPSRIADVAPGTEDRPEQAGRDRRRAWCSAPVARRSVLSQRRARSSRPGPGGRIASGFAAVRIHASSVCEIEGQAHAVPTACRVIAKPRAGDVDDLRASGSVTFARTLDRQEATANRRYGHGVRLLRSWSQGPICWHRLVSDAWSDAANTTRSQPHPQGSGGDEPCRREPPAGRTYDRGPYGS